MQAEGEATQGGTGEAAAGFVVLGSLFFVGFGLEVLEVPWGIRKYEKLKNAGA